MLNMRLLTALMVCPLMAVRIWAVPLPDDRQQQLQLNRVPPADRVRSEIPYQDGTVVLLSDFQERIAPSRYRASGRVEITFKDMTISCDEAEYDEATRQGSATGHIRFSQGQQWLACSKAEFNFANQTGTFYEASGYTDLQFLVRGRTVRKTGPDVYRVQDGFITSCPEPRPKWSFSTSSTTVHVDRTARLRQVLFKVKGIPIFYTPYLVVPMLKKERSSGFIPFHSGNSTSKGRLISEGYYQTLGPSMDLTVYGDYFTLRGLAPGGIFRARPNAETKLYLQAYGMRDKLGQGGAHLIVQGETRLRQGVRAVSQVNITSSFNFRQAFSDSFRSATIPLEEALVFLTQNHEGRSLNLNFEREEILFPVHSLIIRKFPSAEFVALGEPIGKLPLIFQLRSSIDGLSREDSTIVTPRIMQRLDFHPRVALRVPSVAGFSIMPSIGFRETYYSARTDGQPTPSVVGKDLNRHYTDFIVDVRPPTFEKDFRSRFGNFKHVVEPGITYRRIHGITDLRETIRFDAEDAIADTNEVEYGIVNRFFRRPGDGSQLNQEVLSLAIMQKYYFDPSFGGAFIPGQSNIFYPLDTLTGFSNTGVRRNLAPVSGIMRVSPSSGISQEFRADYDPKFGRLRDASISNYWQQGKVFLAGTYFRTQALEPGMADRDHIQGQAAYGLPERGFSASVTLSYNFQTETLLNSQSRLNYMWDCCGVSLEFQQFGLGLRTETRFSFSFTLKGIGSFGNIRRPESLF